MHMDYCRCRNTYVNRRSKTQFVDNAFNTNAIIYDNTPWRPGKDTNVGNVAPEEDDERKFKNLATRIMSNGVEVLVKDKSGEEKNQQRKVKFIHLTPTKVPYHHINKSPTKSLLTSAVATVINQQHLSALIPLQKFMQHNYIIKTCMTTYTYLTTVIQNKRSAISTFETIVSVITTESLTNPYASDLLPDIMPTKTKYMGVKTIQPTTPTHMFQSAAPKIEKRVDSEENLDGFDIIQPSEVDHVPCTGTCSCSNTKTEGLNTKLTNSQSQTKYENNNSGIKPTNKQSDTKTNYGPYESETSSHLAPTDRIVEKYTEVINDYSDEKESSSIELSELLTNEQAPLPPKSNKISVQNKNDKNKTEKPLKVNKNKLVVAELIKLGNLGIQSLSQLAPVIEKITGGFMKLQDHNKTTNTTTIKPVTKLTSYNINKRVDSDLESKQSTFPIYIPMNELETSESNGILSNATLHQNLIWAAEHKQPKSHIVSPKIVHESPLVNGGIPISPGEIIRANSDVIVGKPAVGGPLTLAASGIKMHNPVHPPPLDSVLSGSEPYLVEELPVMDHPTIYTKIDDSFDLRPPEPPFKMIKNVPRPQAQYTQMKSYPAKRIPLPSSGGLPTLTDQATKIDSLKNIDAILGNHGRPAFLDNIPSLTKPLQQVSAKKHVNQKFYDDFDMNTSDNSPSSSEIVSTQVTKDGDLVVSNKAETMSKTFLVDIQPSKVANVLIPHGSSTALIFAGSSEPHKTGDYIDDPLPYPEPGYFGTFSIDAPQMTNVHITSENNKHLTMNSNSKINVPTSNQRKNLKAKSKDTNAPINLNNKPPPTSNQETHLLVGPQITAYNPDVYTLGSADIVKYSQGKKQEKPNDGKDIIDKEYENYLSVPPPPPSNIHYTQENTNDKYKPYNQRPIVHTKPIQDMKVFLNIQHPVPNDQLPAKVTSEVYFASQMSSNKPSPTYTIHMPPGLPVHGSSYSKPQTSSISSYYDSNDNKQHSSIKHNSFILPQSTDYVNKPKKTVSSNIVSDDSYSVILNTATNVASNIGDSGSIFDSSVPVSVGLQNINELKTDIPISTNFTIKEEDGSPTFNNYDTKATGNLGNSYFDYNPFMTDTTWNTSVSSGENKNIFKQNNKEGEKYSPSETSFVLPSINSHANFPMINEHSSSSSLHSDEVIMLNKMSLDKKIPTKEISNIPTNSHGWYSNVPINDINNIKIEATTRKIIPLLHNYSENTKLDYGQKIVSAGKPPTELWSKNISPILTTIGKPFTKPKNAEKQFSSSNQHTTLSYEPKYIPSSSSNTKQPVYDIPIRDNSEETTTENITNRVYENVKPVYETSEEIYDGNDDNVNEEPDGAISLESMKIPVVSGSSEKDINPSSSTEISLLQDEIFVPSESTPKDKNLLLVHFNPGTQTEKPFGSHNKSVFHTNTIKSTYGNSHPKPRPFHMNTFMTLDHQLQQPHWQINNLMENSTNISYEDTIELNTGEQIKSTSSTKSPNKNTVPHSFTVSTNNIYRNPPRPIFSAHPFNNQLSSAGDNSNIITSTVHIRDKKPLIVDINNKTTLPTFTTTTTLDVNVSSSDIIDLSPPPPAMDFNFKPSTNDETIMGMSPPPPAIRPIVSLARPSSPRPILPVRSPMPFKTKPQRTIPPRSTTHRPTKKPIQRDDVFTYRPTFDLNNVKRPLHNRDQPSSQLLPPPEVQPSNVFTKKKESLSNFNSDYSKPTIVFPTTLSSGWFTSSSIDFSSSFSFPATIVYSPETTKPTVTISEAPSYGMTTENQYSYEDESSLEHSKEFSSVQPQSAEKTTFSIKEVRPSNTTKFAISNEKPDSNEFSSYETSQEAKSTTISTTEKIKVIYSALNKTRTRKPYPVRNDEKKSTSKNKLPSKTTTTIRPTRTISRPDVIYPTRLTSSRKIIPPLSTKSSGERPTSIIESSETFVEDDFVRPTETLMESSSFILSSSTTKLYSDEVPASIITSSLKEEIETSVIPTHHAGNEVKIFDEIVPTKTEFKTTIVTLTKTLSEPPTTVSSIGYVNITHTLTVTHTMTSLISQSEGAVTQTLILTNTHTSTAVDVVTEIYTQVQPTTIIETVTKHVPIPQFEATPVQTVTTKTKVALDDVTISSEENENFIIKDLETTENVQKMESEIENDNDTFFVVMNKSQNGGQTPPVNTDLQSGDYDVTRNEQINSNGVSQVLFGEILLAGAPYLETSNPTGITYSKECQPDCKASRNERCQRIEGVMKCVCRPGFARMFPDRPCKPTYTYSVKLALRSQGNEKLLFHEKLSDNSSKEYNALAQAAHEGINRMVMQSDLRDVYHGVHITGFHPVEMKTEAGDNYQGVMNDFYVQLSDNAHESRLKEVIEKYLRNNNYSLGGTDVIAVGELMDKLDVSDFDECTSGQFHDCSEHAQCFNLRGTYTCSCLEGFADLSVNPLYPGRICSAEPVGCERCNYHGACYSRDDRRVLCECFQWYTGSTCQINLKVVLISLVVLGALLTVVLGACAAVACSRRPRAPAPPRSIVACIQGIPQGAIPSKQRADRRALINERPESGDASSLQNASLPYMPVKRKSSSSTKKCVASPPPPAHEAPPPPPSVMIPRARLHQHHDSRDNIARKRSLELSSEEKLISYLESGAIKVSDEMRRKHSMESSYSAIKDRHNKQGALVSAGFKVSTTIRPDDQMPHDRDDLSSVHKADIDAELSRFDSLRKSYSREELSEWTDAERRLGEHTLSEARSVGGTLPASTGRAASSTRLTHQDANTMAERDLGSTFLLPHVHLYKPDITSDVSEFDSL